MPFSTNQSAVGPIRLADGLGLASAALGAPMLFSRRRFLREIGVRADPRAQAVTVAVGVREMVACGTILGMRHRRVGTWSRVGGDTLDLALLARAFATRRTASTRLIGAIAFVAGILGLDLYAAVALTRAEGGFVSDGSGSSGSGAPPDPPGGPGRIRTAITVSGLGEEELRARFAAFDWSALDPSAPGVRFAPAPADRGIEIHVDVDPRVPAGRLGEAALKLAGRAPDQQISDELRRFKALVETGVVVVSDKTPEGPSAAREMLQRPGHPQPAGQSA